MHLSCGGRCDAFLPLVQIFTKQFCVNVASPRVGRSDIHEEIVLPFKYCWYWPFGYFEVKSKNNNWQQSVKMDNNIQTDSQVAATKNGI